MTNTSDASRPPEPAKLNFFKAAIVVVAAAGFLIFGLDLDKAAPPLVLRDSLLQKVGTAMTNGASVEDINQLIKMEPRLPPIVILLRNKQNEVMRILFRWTT